MNMEDGNCPRGEYNGGGDGFKTQRSDKGGSKYGNDGFPRKARNFIPLTLKMVAKAINHKGNHEDKDWI